MDVPEGCDGMRLDRFLALRFPDRSRSWLAGGIREEQVEDASGRPLRPASRVRAGQTLRLFLPGIAPATARPPFPEILHEDARVLVIDKPAGLLAHPAGLAYQWAAISLAKHRFRGEPIDLVHRLDRDTSGCLVLSRDPEANSLLKRAMHDRRAHKVYEALCKGVIPWDRASLRDPIGPADGEIRIQMAVRPDGQPARTDVEVVGRSGGLTRIRCVLHTGRTHQIRVHLAHAGFPLLGDRMYGLGPEAFLHSLDHGADAFVRERAGAPYHALHAAEIRLPHPDGGELHAVAPWPERLQRWWTDPSVLPHDGEPDPT